MGCIAGSAGKNGTQQWDVLMWESNILHMKVGILVYTHCTSSMVSGVADILAFANLQQANGKTTSRKNATSFFEVAIISEKIGRAHV